MIKHKLCRNATLPLFLFIIYLLFIYYLMIYSLILLLNLIIYKSIKDKKKIFFFNFL